jgi:hypothetical protein
MTARNAWSICAVVAAVILNPSIVLSYEVETHADMSRAAANASVLFTDANILQNLGIKSSDEFPNSTSNEPPKSIVELIRDGARFEDNGIRSLNHFYDPIRNTGLIDVIPGVVSSPDWALEDTGQYYFPIHQINSFVDGRGYFYQALTATSKADHDKYFGLTFQTLGQVIHHIQDMAQPQHVRNDPHCDAFVCRIVNRSKPGRYEKYTELPNARDSLIGFERAENCVHP